MITPTVGRRVLYHPRANDPVLLCAGKPKPLAAIITYVHSDTYVNLAVFDVNGSTFGLTSVPFYQGVYPCPLKGYCEWPPQKGQAAKTEAVQAPKNNDDIDRVLDTLLNAPGKMASRPITVAPKSKPENKNIGVDININVTVDGEIVVDVLKE